MKRIFLVLLGMVSLNVNAFDPTYDVTKGALQNNPALCGYGYNPNCGSGSSGNSAPTRIEHITINVPPKFGALAFDGIASRTGAAYDADSKEQAIKDALRSCSAGGKNKHCELMIWVKNGCIAAASGRNKTGKGARFFPVSDLPGESESKAMRKCENNPTVKDCYISFEEMCSLS